MKGLKKQRVTAIMEEEKTGMKAKIRKDRRKGRRRNEGVEK